MVSGNLTILQGTLYIISQLLGALLGYLLINLIHHDSIITAITTTTALRKEVSIAQDYFIEMFKSLVITIAVLMLLKGSE